MSAPKSTPYTPGPWDVTERGSDWEITYKLGDGTWQIGSWDDGQLVAEAMAKPDARLIAAAPELLEALRAVRAMLDEGVTSKRAHALGPLISAAIAKATGTEGEK